MGIKVVKFGGSSLADAGMFRKVKEIILSDPTRSYVVPSAPGKRHAQDIKITDMLYKCYSCVERKEPYEPIFELIAQRYLEIAEELELPLNMRALLDETCAAIKENRSRDFAASRGEYLNGRMLADYLGWDFIDAADVVKFDRQGNFAAEWTNEVMRDELRKHAHAVIPGFYGSYPNGEVHTFSRGGSDISGAIVARAVNADIYENWTDVNGFLMADPRGVENPRLIRRLTYHELRELSYMGANVMHEDAIFPVRRANIPTNIRNTNDPSQPGTLITTQPAPDAYGASITGIAGHKNFTLITLEKGMMNAEIGFGRRVLSALEDFDIPFEHMPTGIDTMSIIIAESELKQRKEQLISRLNDVVHPDSIEFSPSLALIATVGQSMISRPGTAATLFSALADANIPIRMIDQGASELSIIVGVDVHDFERAVQSIYAAFVH